MYYPDFKMEVQRGQVSNVSIMSGLGEREGIGTTAEGEDIWRGNELSPAPTSDTKIPTPADAGEQMTVVSENAQDGVGGTGVQNVRIEYLDASGEEQSEDLAMNGTTEVDTVATDIRFVNDLYSIPPIGSGGVAAGHIKIHKKGSAGLVYNMIAVGGNKSLVPHRMVPANKILLLQKWGASEAQDKRCAFRIRSTDMGGALLSDVFCFKNVLYLSQSSDERELVDTIPALSIVKVSGWAVVTGAEGSCSWWGYLVDTD